MTENKDKMREASVSKTADNETQTDLSVKSETQTLRGFSKWYKSIERVFKTRDETIIAMEAFQAGTAQARESVIAEIEGDDMQGDITYSLRGEGWTNNRQRAKAAQAAIVDKLRAG